ncbi:MAG TPA: hypothetical protein VK184_01235 [Nostocaceae cyanobacterium]|nr:hypothetical protein [Nostocaceae cyanobacterium]
MFGLIKKLISGIIGFITGLLPGKKGGGYYLELKDEEPTPTTVKKAEPATKPAPTPTTTPAPAAKKAAKPEPAPAPAPTEKAFATKYLIPSATTSGRRRPGANMNNFLDMAKNIKTAS